MKLIVGLGNPGSKYLGTRHNVGFEVVDELVRRDGLVFETGPVEVLIARDRSARGVMLAKPLTFMNHSGQTVVDLQRYYRVGCGELLIVVEDVALPLGCLRARARGSGGGHKGLGSVVDALGTEDFARLRIGVGRGDPRRDLAAHVLSRFETAEHADIEIAIGRAADAVSMFVDKGIDPVMNAFNGKDGGSDNEEDRAFNI